MDETTVPKPLSPQKLSPMRPRTMKEYEEELSSLKKENFNLKLTIYFIEERRSQNASTEDKDLLKINTELRVQLEGLLREVAEKDELVIQANKALQMLKEDHNADLNNIRKQHDCDVLVLQEKIEKLEKQLHEQHMTFLESTTRFDDSSAMYTAAFGLNSRGDLKNELEGRVRVLECDLMSEREKSKGLEEQITKTKGTNSEMQQLLTTLKSQLDGTKSRLQDAYADIENKAETISAFELRLRALDLTIGKHEKNLTLKTEELDHKEWILSELSTKVTILERQLIEFESSKNKENSHMNNLEEEVETISQENRKLKQELNHLRNNQDSTPRRGLRERSVGRRSVDPQDRELIKQLKESHLKLEKLEDQFRICQAKLREAHKVIIEKDQSYKRLEGDYSKSCNCLQSVIKTNKQLLREKYEFRAKRDAMADNKAKTQQVRTSSPSSIHHEVMSRKSVTPSRK